MSISSSIISCSFLPFRFLLLFVESCTLTFILFCYNTVILPSVVVFVSVVVSRTSIMSFFWMALDYFLEPVVYLKQSLHFWGRGKVCIHCTLHTPHSTLLIPHFMVVAYLQHTQWNLQVRSGCCCLSMRSILTTLLFTVRESWEYIFSCFLLFWFI